jgi:hypothetical protein
MNIVLDSDAYLPSPSDAGALCSPDFHPKVNPAPASSHARRAARSRDFAESVGGDAAPAVSRAIVGEEDEEARGNEANYAIDTGEIALCDVSDEAWKKDIGEFGFEGLGGG